MDQEELQQKMSVEVDSFNRFQTELKVVLAEMQLSGVKLNAALENLVNDVRASTEVEVRLGAFTRLNVINRDLLKHMRRQISMNTAFQNRIEHPGEDKPS